MHALGVNDVFGIPGDFVLGFYGMLERSPIRIVGTCSELNAGYAADAYARMNGAVIVTLARSASTKLLSTLNFLMHEKM